MSKYIKLEDAINKMDEWFCEPYTPTELLSDLPTIEVSEDCISKAYLEQEIENHLLSTENLRTEKDEWWNKAFNVMVEIIEDAPSVVPTNENEIKLCRNCDNAYLYQDCLYCDEIEEETEIEPDDACSLWKLRESSVKPKEGEWIEDNLGTVICSECKRPRRDSRINHTKFCNSCGARMKGADDESVDSN